MSEVISLIHKHKHKIMWTYKSSFYNILNGVRVWDNSECKGKYVNFHHKNNFMTLAELREQQIKSVLDD